MLQLSLVGDTLMELNSFRCGLFYFKVRRRNVAIKLLTRARNMFSAIIDVH